ncbi:hypothetical protein ACFL2Q_10740 [Thermodesulfobacteriota bacterium]
MEDPCKGKCSDKPFREIIDTAKANYSKGYDYTSDSDKKGGIPNGQDDLTDPPNGKLDISCKFMVGCTLKELRFAVPPSFLIADEKTSYIELNEYFCEVFQPNIGPGDIIVRLPTGDYAEKAPAHVGIVEKVEPRKRIGKEPDPFDFEASDAVYFGGKYFSSMGPWEADGLYRPGYEYSGPQTDDWYDDLYSGTADFNVDYYYFRPCKRKPLLIRRQKPIPQLHMTTLIHWWSTWTGMESPQSDCNPGFISTTIPTALGN